MKTPDQDNPHYNPCQLLDAVQRRLKAKTDRQLADLLEVGPPTISKIRSRNTPVTASILLRMHELTNIRLRELRALMGDFRPHTGPSAEHPTHEQLKLARETNTLLEFVQHH